MGINISDDTDKLKEQLENTFKTLQDHKKVEIRPGCFYTGELNKDGERNGFGKTVCEEYLHEGFYD